jgi:radical SAM superfamily enzyme YgiQ (UPF0313 family)
MKKVNIKLVSVEGGISAIGFRKIVSCARAVYPETEIYFIATDNLYSLSSHFFANKASLITDHDILAIAKELSNADVLGFSCMTASSEYVEKICIEVKKINPACFIIWGGVHPTLYPEISLESVDCICVGEGEITITKLIQNSIANEKIDSLPNTWVKVESQIIKNEKTELNSSDFLSKMPLPFNDYDCKIYDPRHKSFRPLNKFDYIHFNGLIYRTVWTLGCPFDCAYCANDSFVFLDKGYLKLRYPSVDCIINELKNAITINPFISTIGFYDDNLIALPMAQLEYFVSLYKEYINLPFVVFGIHPQTINKDKIELLASAGMNRTRMGIQSGSENTLAFYNRKTSIPKIISATTILAEASRKYNMIMPSYDIISDNPYETLTDLNATLDLLYNLARPYTLNIFSLRVFPKTQLFEYVKNNPIHNDALIENSYLHTNKNLYNILLFILATSKPPKFLYHFIVKKINKEGITKNYPLTFAIIKLVYLFKRAYHHLIRFDFSTIVGKWVYYVWKIKTMVKVR